MNTSQIGGLSIRKLRFYTNLTFKIRSLIFIKPTVTTLCMSNLKTPIRTTQHQF